MQQMTLYFTIAKDRDLKLLLGAIWSNDYKMVIVPQSNISQVRVFAERFGGELCLL